MKKRTKLTKIDVNTICEMQRKIDAYESYLIGLSGLAQRENPSRYIVLLGGTDLDRIVNQCWNNIEEMKRRLQRYEELYGKGGEV